MALACLAARHAPAQTAGDAARELARKIAAAAPGPVALSFRNQSSLPGPAFDEVRRIVEAELRANGSAAAEIRVTASESLRDYLLVAEVRRGLVLMAGWPRPPATSAPTGGINLEKKLVWQQDEPMLDFAVAETGGTRLLLVLETARVAVYAASANGWEPRQSFPIAAPGPPSRDPRGRLTVQAPAFQAYLPGVACRGTLEPPALDCQPGDALWPLVSGATFTGLAAFRPGRNLFDGTIVTAAGGRSAVPPFFSMALAGTVAEPLWIFAFRDGRSAVYNAALAPVGPQVPDWGSDVAGAETRCGSGRQVLATRPGGDSAPDSIEAWEIDAGNARLVSPALDLPGPVTALWPAGAAGASAVVRDPQTGRFAAYAVAIGCGS